MKLKGIAKGLCLCLLVTFIFALPQPVRAGFLVTNPEVFTLTGETTCRFSKDTEDSRLEVPLLLNRLDEGFAPYLAVNSLAITPEPTKIIADARGNLRAVYLNYHNRGTLSVRQIALVETRQVEFIPNKPYVSDGSFAKYLEPSELVESNNPIIQKKAAQVTMGITDPYEKAQAVYAFVQNHMTFDEAEKYSHKGALSALLTGRGRCDDHTALMVALLRASGIPAREMGGYAVDFSSQSEAFGVNLADSARHGWVEFYLKGEGWIPAEPTTSRNKGDNYPKWSHFGALNSNWEYIPDSIGKTLLTSYTYIGSAPKIEELVTIKEGYQELDNSWYLVMSNTGSPSCLCPATFCGTD